jgi:hypothetical protein
VKLFVELGALGVDFEGKVGGHGREVWGERGPGSTAGLRLPLPHLCSSGERGWLAGLV